MGKKVIPKLRDLVYRNEKATGGSDKLENLLENQTKELKRQNDLMADFLESQKQLPIAREVPKQTDVEKEVYVEEEEAFIPDADIQAKVKIKSEVESSSIDVDKISKLRKGI